MERKRGEKKKTKKRVIKHTLKYLYEAYIKNPRKQGRILEVGGGEEDLFAIPFTWEITGDDKLKFGCGAAFYNKSDFILNNILF